MQTEGVVLPALRSRSSKSSKVTCTDFVSAQYLLNASTIQKIFYTCPLKRRHAFPGSEFVVANTLAKWKKLEPNEINFSQGFSQKVVSTSCFVVFAKDIFVVC